MTAKRVVSIGQEAFVLSSEGEIVRTMVAKLYEDGYQFLNGDSSRRPHYFSFKHAIAAADDCISNRQSALRKQLRALTLKRRALETQAYRDGVMNVPYKVAELRDEMIVGFAMSRRTRKLRKIRVPEMHLMPNQVVYAVMTPSTRPNPGWEVYRPHKYFILETEVTSVCFSPDGQVYYTFSTRFVVGEFFLSREEATAKLKSFLEPGTKDPVPFVSSKEEKRENEKLLDDNIPF